MALTEKLMNNIILLLLFRVQRVEDMTIYGPETLVKFQDDTAIAITKLIGSFGAGGYSFDVTIAYVCVMNQDRIRTDISV